MVREDRHAVFLLALVCSPLLLVTAGVQDDITPYRFLATPPEELHAQGRDLLQERELEGGSSIACANGTVARWIRTRCNSDQVEYFMYRNSACAGDPLTISQGPAELAALYTCEKTDDSKFGLRYGGYGAYLYGACVDGQVVLEIHAEEGCHDGIANYVYPSQDCDAMCVPAPPIGLGADTPCFTGLGEAPIPNCTCAIECSSCGYSENPVDVNDCIVCKDGLILYNTIGSDTGYCSPPEQTKCFAQQGGNAIAECTCDPSCSACGFAAMPVGPTSCLTCQPGLMHHQIYPDGTGYCLDEAAGSTCWEDERGGTRNADCQCDSSCSECGFDVMPTSAEQCMGCKMPLGMADRDLTTGLGPCSPTALCYSEAGGDPIEGCNCHPDCFSCGYGTAEDPPIDMNQCIICGEWSFGAMFLNQTLLNADGTGPCYKPVLCFADMEHRIARKPIPNCECHPNCQSCGYSETPQGYDHCLSCIDGMYMNEITTDGVGFCDYTPCMMFCMGQGGIIIGPYGKPALMVMGLALVVVSMAVYKLKKLPKGVEVSSEGEMKTSTYGSTASNKVVEGESLMKAYHAEQRL